jgi:hypothetical protein
VYQFTFAAVFDPLAFSIQKKGGMSQTSLLLIKGTVAEQTVKIFFFFYLMAWKILTLPILKKLITL